MMGFQIIQFLFRGVPTTEMEITLIRLILGYKQKYKRVMSRKQVKGRKLAESISLIIT